MTDAMEIVLPAGTPLFHGTIEPIKGALRPGGDRILWFADDPRIAQLYIPRAGTSMFTDPERLTRPSRNPFVLEIQRELGIHYDLDDVEWDARGDPRSWPLPEGWDRTVRAEDVKAALEARGYEPYAGRGLWASYRLYFSFVDEKPVLLPPGGTVLGALYVAFPRADLHVADLTELGGDLMDPAHLWLSRFRALDERGFDGVLINDYAQSEAWGNLGHKSLGIFPDATDLLEIEAVVPARYEEFSFEAVGTTAWPRPTPTDFMELRESA